MQTIIKKPMDISLTEHLVQLLDRPIAPSARARAKLHLLDWLGYASLGAISVQGLALRHYGRNQAEGPCSTLGSGFHDAANAAFVNGGLGNIYELDDVHRTSIMHAGDVVIPAALAIAQRENVSGETLLNALVKGYESAIRIGIAVSNAGYTPWYNSSTCGVFGAASAAALVLNLKGQALTDALGQAGMQASGIWQCRLEPSFSKQLASAKAAQSGVIAADLAKIGFPGPRFILEGELGFFKAYYPEADQEAVVADPQNDWKIFETSFKPWPACRHTHPVIEAGFDLRKTGDIEDIAEISVTTYQAALDFCDNANPESEHEGQFSLQHCLAIALVKGDVTLADFSPEALGALKLTNLRQKIHIEAKDNFTKAFPSLYGTEVVVTYIDGSRKKSHIETAKGDPENPFSEQEIITKFHNCLALANVSKPHADDLKAAIDNLGEEENINTLSSALRAISADIDKNDR